MCLNNVLHITYGLFILSNKIKFYFIIISQWRKICQMGGFSYVYVLTFAEINGAVMNMEVYH